jgi:hypothetical protein
MKKSIKAERKPPASTETGKKVTDADITWPYSGPSPEA